MKFKKKEDTKTKFRKVNDPRLLGSEKEKAISQYGQMSSYIPKVTNYADMTPKYGGGTLAPTTSGQQMEASINPTKIDLTPYKKPTFLEATKASMGSALYGLGQGLKDSSMGVGMADIRRATPEQVAKEQAERQSVIERIPSFEKPFYGALGQAPQMALTAINPTAALPLLSGLAASSKTKELKEQGVSDVKANLGGITSGLVELGTEYLPTQRFAKLIGGKGSLKDVIVEAGQEFVGEGLSELKIVLWA